MVTGAFFAFVVLVTCRLDMRARWSPPLDVHGNPYPFMIERWSRGFHPPYEAVGGSLNQILARALFNAAVEHEPGGWWRLRHGARVLAQWPEG